jgi:ATP/maltotriose-dependent transcriptional regulator MalT
MLETIRAYALEQLDATGETEEIRGRLLAWCLDLAELSATSEGGDVRAAWLDRLEAEHDNFRAALTYSETAGCDPELGLRLAGWLADFWLVRGYHREARARLSRLLARSPARTAVRAEALDGAGFLAVRQNDYDAATPLLEEALAIWRELGDKRGTARTLLRYGVVPHHQGRFEEARAMLEESLALSRELGRSQGVEMALHYLADLELDSGRDAQATARYEQSLALARQHGNQHGIAYAVRGLGHVARARGEYGQARAYLRESLSLLRALRDRRCIPLCLEGLACLAVGPDWAERAARLLGGAQALQATTGAPAPPSELADYQRTEADARASLGAERFATLWSEGAALSLEEAIEYALSEDPVSADVRVVADAQGQATLARIGPVDDAVMAPAGPSVTPSAQDVPLSAREREVVALIAEGLSNRQIAECLVISVRTVERHIENVYNRLGISGKAGRAIVTAYALRHGLMGLTVTR